MPIPGSAATKVRLTMRVALLWFRLVCLASGLVFAHVPAALALKAIEVSPDADRVEITALGEAYEGRGDTLQIETAPGADGIRGRMSVRAATPGTNPSWLV